MEDIIVYSAPNCFKCEQLKNKLKQKNIEFVEINIRENEESLIKLKENGFRELPVVGYNNKLFTQTQFEVELR